MVVAITRRELSAGDLRREAARGGAGAGRQGGAVAAAVEVVEKNTTFPGVIGEMIQPILPAALSVRGQSGDWLDNAVSENAKRVARRLKAQSPVLRDALGASRLKIAAARYDLDDGDVDWFEDA